ncbi:DUF5977 domain-containing protein [Spirosoma oryzicola]|uniref:DUF5977 domain-containing protein n=1 Tax=Spirosoma oryzicola TaxID=2898794 RepID=UPI001E2E1B31|nr:DUF5977 domain-containing protein [Spirosoma oryzicola]UHG93386.1 DUF5977 domain-containing protein [Spirosoma oryzicola]
MIDPLATNLVFQPLHFSRNRLDVLIDPADTTLTDRSDLRYALTVLVPSFPQSSELEELTTLVGRERPPQTVGGLQRFDGAQFRIDQVLDGFLETQKPDFNQSIMSIVPTMTMPYCLREAVTGGHPAVDTERTRPKEWVFKGGLTGEDFAGWSDHFFDSYLRDTRQFLTWQPDEKIVSLHQPEFLYFLLNCSPVPATINLRIQVNYPNGNSDVRTLSTLSGASINQVVCVPVGMYPNGLGYDVASYDVWLSDGANNRISQVRTFVIDSTEQAQERFILFENSLGGFDTLRILGQGSLATTVQRITVETDPQSTAIDAAQLRVIQIESDQSLTVSTGYFSSQAGAWARYLNELLLSKSIYLVTAKGHVPLLLTTTELVTHEDDADLIARTLSFRKAKIEQNYSQLPATSSGPARPTAWRGIGFQQILDGYGKRTGLGAPIRLRKYYVDDGSDVKPIIEKPNAVGNADYISPTPIPGVVPGSTPYPSTPISRTGRFKRSTCPSGQEGGPATVVVLAGKYGSETQADADARAEAEFASLDTQAYADNWGSCSLSETYSWNLPAGQWHVRFSSPGSSAIFHNDGQAGPADMGNTQSLQGQAGQFVYLAGSNDLNFPAADANWLLYSLGAPFATKRLKLYKNGVLLRTQDFTHNKDGYEQMSLVGANGMGPVPQSGELYYVKFEDR